MAARPPIPRPLREVEARSVPTQTVTNTVVRTAESEAHRACYAGAELEHSDARTFVEDFRIRLGDFAI